MIQSNFFRTDNEIDYLEKFIPTLAQSATRKACQDALCRGNTVTEIVDGKIVETAPDGTRTIIGDAKPMVKVC
ncbi:MAG: hypothetical protein JXR76_08345 [Deltaproteobacteria bacterium]|nr:hypothetical protein [Deltaproteobacteria bacterium]